MIVNQLGQAEIALIAQMWNNYQNPSGSGVIIPLNFDPGGTGSHHKLDINALNYLFGQGFSMEQVHSFLKNRNMYQRKYKTFTKYIKTLFTSPLGPFEITETIIQMMRDDCVPAATIKKEFSNYFKHIRPGFANVFQNLDFKEINEALFDLVKEGRDLKYLANFFSGFGFLENIQGFLDEYFGSWLEPFMDGYYNVAFQSLNRDPQGNFALEDLTDLLIADKLLALMDENPTLAPTSLISRFKQPISGSRMIDVLDRVFGRSFAEVKMQVYTCKLRDLILSTNYQTLEAMVNDFATKFGLSEVLLNKIFDTIIISGETNKRLGWTKKEAVEFSILGPIIESFLKLGYRTDKLVRLIGFFDSEIDLKRWIIKFFGPLDLSTSQTWSSNFDSIISTIFTTSNIDYRRRFGVNPLSSDFEMWTW